MATQTLSVTREIITAKADFDTVVSRIFDRVGRTTPAELAAILAEPDFGGFSQQIEAATGPSGLMEFATFDLGDALAKDGRADAYRIVRIVAGNPLIMREMVASVPHAGSYAPVTILVYEEDGGVKLAYDRMESYLRPFAQEPALVVARALDRKITDLMSFAAA